MAKNTHHHGGKSHPNHHHHDHPAHGYREHLAGGSTNPPATTGGGGAPSIGDHVSDQHQASRISFNKHNPAKGEHTDGDFSHAHKGSGHSR